MIEREIEIHLLTPMIIPNDGLSLRNPVDPHIAGVALKGALRQCFRQTIGDHARLESEIFGSTTTRGCMSISNAPIPGGAEEMAFVKLDPRTGSANTGKLYPASAVPESSVFRFIIRLDEQSSSEAMRAADSAIQWLQYIEEFPFSLGTRQISGFGQAKFQLLNFSQVGKVFISYTHEDAEHASWVLNVADRLDRVGFDVLLDAYDLAPGDNIHFFMERAIEDASKVLIVLTPTYKKKASSRQGGVGYEFSMIISELSENLANNRKYVPVLRRGTTQDSIPIMLKPYLYCDARGEDFEKCSTAISDAVLGKSQKTRPRER